MKSKKTAIDRSLEDKIFDGVVFTVLTILFLLVAYPLYFVIIASVSDPHAVSSGDVVLFPIGFTLDGYTEVFATGTVMRGFFNSLYYTAVGVLINLVVTIPTAYALARDDFYGKKPIMIFYLITMFVSGGLIPTYMVVMNMGMLNTVWALTVPGAIGVFNLIVCRTFFVTNLPPELLEAAKMDGCGNTRFFISIVLPLSAAIIAVQVLFNGVAHWNSFFSALIYISERARWPLQLELRNILINNTLMQEAAGMIATTPEAIAERQRLEALMDMMRYSLIIVASIPVLIMYPFIQRHFVKGVTFGSVKG
ncbi:MAG: carbohydrate ABC transporter permease [Firmicutes bacterium]|nr:carbohydrate ABC transporter permease [Bacillota bacterium]